MNSLEILRQWLRARHARPTSDNATILQLWCVESVDKVFIAETASAVNTVQSCLQVVDSETRVCGEDLEFELVKSSDVGSGKSKRVRQACLETYVPSDISGCLRRKHPQPYQRSQRFR
jgi:hypothetical protein